MRVEATLDGYWDRRPGDMVKDAIFGDWISALENYSPEEIQSACREYITGPDRARKPKPGDIRDIILRGRQRVAARQQRPVEPKRDVISAEKAAEIMASVGFKAKKM